MKTVARSIFLSLLLAVAGSGWMSAQPSVSESPEIAAAQFRSAMVTAVAGKSETPAAALARLKAHDSPTGLKIDRDADFAIAAIDVGHRLLATGKPADADPFFKEAEKALAAAVTRTPDEVAEQKAMLLQKLAHIRENFLGKKAEAAADLERAVTLQPENELLLARRERLKDELLLRGSIAEPRN